MTSLGEARAAKGAAQEATDREADLFPSMTEHRDFDEHAVEFQTFWGLLDPVRQGKGSVRIANGVLIIRGRRRKLFVFGRAEERIAVKDVHDVTVEGRLVRFQVEGQAAKFPRLLRLPTPTAAQKLASSLPKRISADGAQAKADVEAFARFLRERGAAYITLGIIALNLAIYIIGGVKGAGWFSGNATVLLAMGGNFASSTALGEWWRLISSMFLHAGLVHVAFNMWALWEAGRIAERLFGRGRFALIYLAAGLLGGIASINWQQDLVGVGASGAVFGVYGALLAALILRKDLLPLSVAKKMTMSTLAFMAYSLFNGFTKTGIDNAAHLGGLLAGLLLGAGLVASAIRMWASVALTGAMLSMGAARAVELAEPIRDEKAFRAFLVSFTPEETRLNAATQTLFTAVKTTPTEEFLRQLDGEIITGWREQHGRISRITHVTPQSRKSRDLIAQFIKLRLESLEDIHAGVKHNDEQRVLSGKAKLDQANAVVAAAGKSAAGKQAGRLKPEGGK